MESSARAVPAARSERPTSLSIVLPAALLSIDRALWRVRSIQLYADPAVRRYCAYAQLEPQQGYPLEDAPALELVGEGPDLLAAVVQLFSSPLLVASSIEDDLPSGFGGVQPPERGES